MYGRSEFGGREDGWGEVKVMVFEEASLRACLEATFGTAGQQRTVKVIHWVTKDAGPMISLDPPSSARNNDDTCQELAYLSSCGAVQAR